MSLEGTIHDNMKEPNHDYVRVTPFIKLAVCGETVYRVALCGVDLTCSCIAPLDKRLVLFLQTSSLDQFSVSQNLNALTVSLSGIKFTSRTPLAFQNTVWYQSLFLAGV